MWGWVVWLYTNNWQWQGRYQLLPDGIDNTALAVKPYAGEKHIKYYPAPTIAEAHELWGKARTKPS